MAEPLLPVQVVAGLSPDCGKPLSLTQCRALAWRASTGADSYVEVAEIAGVAESTVRYWMQHNPRFRSLWDAATERLEEITLALRQHGRLRSVRTLIEVQDRDGVPDSVRVDAASKFLTNDRQERALEQSDAEDIFAEMLKKWFRRARGEDQGEDEPSAIDGEARALAEGDAP